jgi:hypothetical protein
MIAAKPVFDGGYFAGTQEVGAVVADLLEDRCAQLQCLFACEVSVSTAARGVAAWRVG